MESEMPVENQTHHTLFELLAHALPLRYNSWTTHSLRIHCMYCTGGTEMPQLHSGLSGCHNSVAERWRLKPCVLASIPASCPLSLYSILPQPFISSVKRCFMGGDYWQGLTCTSVTSHNVLSAILI